MSDFTTYFGAVVNSQLTGRYSIAASIASGGTAFNITSNTLYDSLDLFFREGGVQAYVSRMVSSTATNVQNAKATITSGKITLTAISGGSWANVPGTLPSSGPVPGLRLTVSAPVNSVYYASIALNGTTIANSPGLGNEQDIVNWVNSLPAYQSLCVATFVSGGTSNISSGVTISLAAGTDFAPVDADLNLTLSVFTADLGVGQMSYPGGTSTANYSMLTAYSQLTNRIAVLDAVDTATASTMTTAVNALATTLGSVTTLLGAVNQIDASYAGMYAPWMKVPGITQTNPNQVTGLVFQRTVPPSALAAAKMAQNDQANDCNVPAAGVGPGASFYATGVTQTYNDTDRASLNNGGVNVVRLIPNVNQIVIYGSRSCSSDANWVYLNNCRFRMQVIRELDLIAENFTFDQIDGRGQIFARLNGALAGQLQTYWIRRSIYGANPSDAFQVNTGTTVNTPATIAAGQMNAQVGLRMSPFGEFVNVSVTKYATNASLPNYTNNFVL
jgi:hypothetical protein